MADGISTMAGRSVVVGTAGHIDHGKSALVRALTGIDPDRLKEEKARGITIDLGFAHTTIDGIDFAFVDVPGHERFVKNMLAGVGGIDLVVLVVAADESVMPQTREHFDICRLLRVSAGLVALTKADLADEETLELARLEVRELTAGSFLEGAPIVPVSSTEGTGLDAFRAALVQAAARAAPRTARRATRLPIDRVFSMKGFGTVVTGTLASGRIAVDRELVILPGGRTVKVRGVQVHGRREPEARAGQRAAVNLGGVEVEDVARGQSLVTPDAYVATRVADAVIEVLPTAKPLKHAARIRFHQGTAEIIGRVALVQADDVGGRPAERADRARGAIEPGARGFVRLRLEAPVVLARGDRYVIRAYSPPVTIAGGQILDPAPPRGRLRTASAAERLRRLDVNATSDPGEAERRAAAALVDASGAAGLTIAELVSRIGVDAEDTGARVAELSAMKAAVLAGDVLVAPELLRHLKDAVIAALTEHHRAQPLSEGVPREELRARLFARGREAVFDRALEELAGEGRIAVRDRIALATHRVALSSDEERVRAEIERAYRAGGLKPPDASAVAAAAGIDPAVADRIVKLLVRQKMLVRIDTLLFHEEALKQLKADVAALKTAAAAARIDVGTFKERFGVSRKFAIPLLEYLDRERVTRRAGDVRIVL
jgi:selenocysteine-specific elongation factor